MRPPFEAEASQQLEARHVVSEGTCGQRLQAQCRALSESLLEQHTSDHLPAMILGYVDADLGSRTVGRPFAETLKAHPAGDLSPHFRNPYRMTLRVVFVEPGKPALN